MPLEDNFFHFPKVKINNMTEAWNFKAGATLAFLTFRPEMKYAAFVKVMTILRNVKHSIDTVTELQFLLGFGFLETNNQKFELRIWNLVGS
jgi:hypothetical protein